MGSQSHSSLPDMGVKEIGRPVDHLNPRPAGEERPLPLMDE